MGRPRKPYKKTQYSPDKLELFKLGGTSNTMLKQSTKEISEEKITSNQQLTETILKCMEPHNTTRILGKGLSFPTGNLRTVFRRRKDSVENAYEVVQENTKNEKPEPTAEKNVKFVKNNHPNSTRNCPSTENKFNSLPSNKKITHSSLSSGSVFTENDQKLSSPAETPMLITENCNKSSDQKQLISIDLEPDKIKKRRSINFLNHHEIQATRNFSEKPETTENAATNVYLTNICKKDPSKKEVLTSVFRKNADKNKSQENIKHNKSDGQKLRFKTVINIESPSDLNSFRINETQNTASNMEFNAKQLETSKNLTILENKIRKSVIVDPLNNESVFADVKKKINSINNVNCTNEDNNNNNNNNESVNCIEGNLTEKNNIRNPFRYMLPEIPNAIAVTGAVKKLNDITQLKKRPIGLINIFFPEIDFCEFDTTNLKSVNELQDNCKILESCLSFLRNVLNDPVTAFDVKSMCKHIILIIHDCFMALLPKIDIKEQTDLTQRVIMCINSIITLFPYIEYNLSCINLSYVSFHANPHLWSQIMICTQSSKYYLSKINTKDLNVWMTYVPKHTFCFTSKINFNQCIIVQRLESPKLFVNEFNIRNKEELEIQNTAYKFVNNSHIQHFTQQNAAKSKELIYYDDKSANFQKELSNTIGINNRYYAHYTYNEAPSLENLLGHNNLIRHNFPIVPSTEVIHQNYNNFFSPPLSHHIMPSMSHLQEHKTSCNPNNTRKRTDARVIHIPPIKKQKENDNQSLLGSEKQPINTPQIGTSTLKNNSSEPQLNTADNNSIKPNFITNSQVTSVNNQLFINRIADRIQMDKHPPKIPIKNNSSMLGVIKPIMTAAHTQLTDSISAATDKTQTNINRQTNIIRPWLPNPTTKRSIVNTESKTISQELSQIQESQYENPLNDNKNINQSDNKTAKIESQDFSGIVIKILKDFLNDTSNLICSQKFNNHDYLLQMFQKNMQMVSSSKKGDKVKQVIDCLKLHYGKDFSKIMANISNNERMKHCTIKEEVIELNDDVISENFKSIAHRFKNKPSNVDGHKERSFSQQDYYIPQNIPESETEKYQVGLPIDSNVLGKEYETDSKSGTDSIVVLSDDEDEQCSTVNCENNQEKSVITDKSKLAEINTLKTIGSVGRYMRSGSTSSDNYSLISELELPTALNLSLKPSDNTNTDSNLFLTPDMINRINEIIPRGKLAYIRSQSVLIRYFDSFEIATFSKTVNSDTVCQESYRESIELPENVLFSTQRTLNVTAYVTEHKKVTTYVPKDFSSYYSYVTKFQIVNGNSPVSFNTFLNMHNTGKTKELYDKYIKYIEQKAISNELEEYLTNLLT